MPSYKTEAVLFLTENEKADPNIGVTKTHEVRCFFKIVKIQLFCCFITQLTFILNTRCLIGDIWLLSYEQNSFITVAFLQAE